MNIFSQKGDALRTIAQNKKNVVWITGVAGFLGRYAAQHFADRGWLVCGFGRRFVTDKLCAELGVDYYFGGGITEQNLSRMAMQSGFPIVIIHCAGSSSVSYAAHHPLEDFQSSVATTALLLDFLRRHSNRTRLILASSAAVYGSSSRDAQPLREGDMLSPCSVYGLHKRMAEDLMLSRATNDQLICISVRFFSLFGRGLKKQLLWDASQKFMSDDFTFDGTGLEQRDFLHVTDAASLLYLLANLKLDQGQFVALNGGTGVGTTICDVLNMLRQAAGIPGSVRFSRGARVGDPSHLVADISATRRIGWEPVTTLEEGLRDYAKWSMARKNTP